MSNWLKGQSTQQQTTQTIKRKEYKPIYSEDYYSYQIDFTFLNKYKNSNDGIYVLFTAININSRYAYAYYGKNKETTTILKFLEQFKKESKEIHTITTDLGSEFTNNNVKTGLKIITLRCFMLLVIHIN